MGLLVKRKRSRNRRKAAGRGGFQVPRLAWARLARVAGGVGAVAAVALLVTLGIDRPVQSFVIDGPFQRVAAVEVQQAALGALSGGFVSADLDRIRKSVEALTWVDRARVQRLWPDRIRIEVVEQQAAARWGDDGLLNTRGELIATGVRHVPPELPRLDGPPGTEWQVAQRFLTVQDRLTRLGLAVSALRLDARGAWEFDLSTGVTVRLGRRQVDERMDRFVQFGAQVIAGRAAEIRHVDMRYSNGFAIGWRGNRRPKDAVPSFAARTRGVPGIDG
jgi:cell division protein FtsQ